MTFAEAKERTQFPDELLNDFFEDVWPVNQTLQTLFFYAGTWLAHETRNGARLTFQRD